MQIQSHNYESSRIIIMRKTKTNMVAMNKIESSRNDEKKSNQMSRRFFWNAIKQYIKSNQILQHQKKIAIKSKLEKKK